MFRIRGFLHKMPLPISRLQEPRRKAGRGTHGLVLALGLAGLWLACAHAPKGSPRLSAEVPASLWALPAEALSTQSLFRLRGAEGGGGAELRLVLYLEDDSSYQLTVTDALGRGLWRLEVGRGGTILQDHRNRTYCQPEAGERSGGGAVGGMLFGGLPRLLNGRVPFNPVASVRRADGSWRLRDAAGHRWAVEEEHGEAQGWEARRAGRTVARWKRRPQGGELTIRGRGKIEWRLMIREPLAGELEPPGAPAGYLPVDCDAKTISELWQGQPASRGAGAP